MRRRPIELDYRSEIKSPPPDDDQSKTVGFGALVFGLISWAAGVPGLAIGVAQATFHARFNGEFTDTILVGLFVIGSIGGLTAIVLGIISLHDNGRRERAGAWGLLMGVVFFLCTCVLLPITASVLR